MRVEVLYFADLKDITNIEKENFDIKEKSLFHLVNLIFEKYSLIKNILWDVKNNFFKSTVSIAINEKLINKNHNLSIELSEGDRIAFLLPVSGG